MDFLEQRYQNLVHCEKYCIISRKIHTMLLVK